MPTLTHKGKFSRLILSLLMLLPVTGSAQQISVEGVVVDADNGTVLPFASIYVSPLHSTITNAEGEFRIVVEPGDELIVSYAG